jgi:hypothetical protein
VQVQVQAQAQPSGAGHSKFAAPHFTPVSRSSRAGRQLCTIPILTFSGSQVGPFLAQGRGPCLQQIFCLPPVEIAGCQAKHASGCLSTVDDSLVRVYWQHISGIVAQSSQQALDEEGKKSKKPWRSGPAVVGVGSRRGQDAVLERTRTQKECMGKKERETNTRGSTQIIKSTCILCCAPPPASPYRCCALASPSWPLEVKLPPRAFSPRN